MDNHWYKKNDIAVLLAPDDKALRERTLIHYTYDSTNCDAEIELTLHRDNTYQLQLENGESMGEIQNGVWKFTHYPYLVLVSANKGWRFYFKVEHLIKADNVSKIQMTQLQPEDEYHELFGCHFVYGIRV